MNKIICCERGLISQAFELRKNAKKETHTKSGVFSLRVDLINFDDNKSTMLWLLVDKYYEIVRRGTNLSIFG